MPSNTSSWHKAFCKTCQRDTYHAFSPSACRVTCTDHSDYIRRNREPIGTIQLGSLYSQSGNAPTDHEIRLANRLDRSMWRMSSERKTIGVPLNDPALAQQMLDESIDTPVLDINQKRCSFCGAPVDAVQALSERKAVIRFVTDTFRDASGQVVQQERVTSKVEDRHACPNCVLQIRKPIVVRTV